LFHLAGELGRGQRFRQPGPLHAHEFLRHEGVVFARLVDHDRQDERHAARHVARAVGGLTPFPAKIAFRPALGDGGDERKEEDAIPDLAADFLVPGVAAPQFALVEPDLDAGPAQGLGHDRGGAGVLAGVAEENRPARRSCAFSHEWHELMTARAGDQPKARREMV
jgi:hypothetical protein